MSRAPLDAEGPAAPPRANGELVFEAPWEARLFGVTMALCDGGRIEWTRFRECLIEEIGAWDARHGPDEPYAYYARWLSALERTLDEAGLCPRTALEARAAQYAARPHGHDH